MMHRVLLSLDMKRLPDRASRRPRDLTKPGMTVDIAPILQWPANHNGSLYQRGTVGKVLILKHPGLWDVKRKLPPHLPVRCTQTGAHGPPIDGFLLYDEPPAPSADEFLADPVYRLKLAFKKNASRMYG